MVPEPTVDQEETNTLVVQQTVGSTLVAAMTLITYIFGKNEIISTWSQPTRR